MPDSASTSHIQTQLHNAIQDLVAGFVAQPPAALKQNEPDLRALQTALDALPNSAAAARKAIEQSISELQPSEADQRRLRRREVAEALVAAAHALKLPVKLKNSNTPGAPRKGPGGRTTVPSMTREQMQAAKDLILPLLPLQSSGQTISKTELIERTQLTQNNLIAALRSLKRNGQALGLGRGRVAGWVRPD